MRSGTSATNCFWCSQGNLSCKSPTSDTRFHYLGNGERRVCSITSAERLQMAEMANSRLRTALLWIAANTDDVATEIAAKRALGIAAPDAENNSNKGEVQWQVDQSIR